MSSIVDYFQQKLEARRKAREPEKFALVATFCEDFPLANDEKKIKYRFYYRLYESNKGNRKVEFASTSPDLIGIGALDFIANQRIFYHEKIARWKQGRFDPDVPRFDQVPEEDMANALRGKVQ